MYLPITIALLFIVWIIYNFNKMVKAKNQVDNADSSINVALKNRFDLIPNLAEVVATFTKHESDLLLQLTTLRKNNDPMYDSDGDADHELKKIYNTVKATAENYPDLKSSANYIELHQTWKQTEQMLAASRRFYNTAVMEYNSTIETFPRNIMAHLLGYQNKKMFQLTAPEAENVNAKNLFK